MKYVLISNVIHEVHDKQKYFKEVYRVLEEKGYFLIIDWDKREMEMGPPIHERISSDEMAELCSAAGFKLLETLKASPAHYGLILEKL